MTTPVFFPDDLEIPPPPAELADCGMEWRAGYGIGWRTGPALTPTEKRPFIGRHTAMAGKRQKAVQMGLDAGREAKRALVAEYVERAQAFGTPLSAVWGGWERDGWLFADAFLFPYGTSKLPACVPASSVLTAEQLA